MAKPEMSEYHVSEYHRGYEEGYCDGYRARSKEDKHIRRIIAVTYLGAGLIGGLFLHKLSLIFFGA